MSSSLSENYILSEELYYNLCVLGVNTYLKKQSLQNQFVMDKNTFKTPNTKAFFPVSHFLFNLLDPKETEEQFKYCWPIISKKEEQEFRKISSKWLKTLAQDPDCYTPNFAPSLLLSPGGDKFCHLYLSFSRLVMQKCVSKRETLHYPKADCEYADAAIQLINIGTQNCIEGIKMAETAFESRHKQCRDTLKSLVEINCDLKAQIRQYSSSDYTSVPLNNDDVYQSALVLWKRVESVCLKAQSQLTTIQSVITDLNLGINGLQYQTALPNAFISANQNEMRKVNVIKLFSNGQLKLENLLKLINIALNAYREKLTRLGGKIGSKPTDLNTTAHRLHCKSIAELKDRVNAIIPQLEDSLEQPVVNTELGLLQNYPLIATTPRFNGKQFEAKQIESWTKGLKLTPTIECKTPVFRSKIPLPSGSVVKMKETPKRSPHTRIPIRQIVPNAAATKSTSGSPIVLACVEEINEVFDTLVANDDLWNESMPNGIDMERILNESQTPDGITHNRLNISDSTLIDEVDIDERVKSLVRERFNKAKSDSPVLANVILFKKNMASM